jgi:hypothetical protein
MELVELIWSLAQIAGQTVGNGALAKIGENLLDATLPKVRELYDVLLNKLPESPTTKAIKAGQELDYDQLVIDVQAIKQDPEVIKLAAEIRLLIAQNQELQAKLNAEIAKIRTQSTYVNRGKSSPMINGSVQSVTINYGNDN